MSDRDPNQALESILAAVKAGAFDAALFATALDAIRSMARAASESYQESAAAVARQSATLLRATDELRLLTTRDPDVRSSLARLRDSLERSRLAALNAGLDGSRMGEAGRGLLAAADDMRAQLTRGIDAFEEHSALLLGLEREFGRLRRDLDATHDDAQALREAAQRTYDEHRRVDDAIARVTDALRGAAELDPATAEAVTHAAEHAIALRRALEALGPRASRVPALEELRQRLAGIAGDPTGEQ